jgi:hypothetical protein
MAAANMHGLRDAVLVRAALRAQDLPERLDHQRAVRSQREAVLLLCHRTPLPAETAHTVDC